MEEWEIVNFSRWRNAIVEGKGAHCIECNSYISLYPKGEGGTGEFILLKFNTSYTNNVNELHFIGSDGNVICTRNDIYYHNPYWTNKGKTITGPKFEEVVTRIRKNEPRYKDRLILQWRGSGGNQRYRTVLDASSIIQTPKTKHAQNSPPENAVNVLAKDLMCLYKDNHLSDLELRCETVSFPTHRAILSARSPVFKAMLSGDMKEAACGHVDIEDVDPHTLGRFLSYLYSGATGEEALQWAEASKLYYAADKYQVPSLKKECSVVLRASVSLDNACDILSLADRHHDEELRSVVYDFIMNNYSAVLGSENWEKFMSSDAALAVKTLTNIAKMKNVQISFK